MADAGGIPQVRKERNWRTITSSPKETSQTTNIDFGATFCGGYRSLFTYQFPTPKIDSNILHLVRRTMKQTRSSRKTRKTGGIHLQDSESSFQHNTTMPDPSIPPKDRCPLLELPAELRNKLYEFLFVYGVIRIQGDRCDKACYQNGIGSNKSKGCHFSLPAVEEVLRKCDGELVCKERSSSPAVALFRAFRQLYEEAAPVLYSRNMFFFNQCRHECQVVVPNNDIYTSALPGAVVFLKRLSPDVKDRIKKIKIVLGLYNSGLWRDFASREETMNFWSIMDREISLNHLSIIHRGWPENMQNGQCLWETKFLLSTRSVKRFSLEMWATTEDTTFGAHNLVSFAAIGNESFNTANIVVHNRHFVTCFRPWHGQDRKRRVVFQRSKERLLVARCNGDDDTGQSYLTPAERLSPPFRGSHQESILLSFLTIRGLLYPFPTPPTYDEFRKQTLRVTFPYGEPPFLPLSFIPNDYKDDDDGENDSLNEVDVSSEPDIFSLLKVQELLTTCKTVAQVTSASSWSISNETVNYVEADNDEEDEDDEDEDEQEEEDDDDDDDEGYEGV
ncbi:uncharacterized protein IWZ02DRAFT_434441 [Phyllosticta citriasiana]|uniref:uncharacterized protein n=1 Tax=Phyllosticta citriasiana TaxID=595635 RepID=UPI0030FDB088